MGNIFRFFIRHSGIVASVDHYIGPYGPFKLDSYFAFSKFSEWGKGHNNGFIKCVDECRNKMCVFDVGAHIGLVSLPISNVINENGYVYAFEPAEANLKYLNRHIRMNNIENIKVISNLVGSSNKENVDFFELSDPSGMNASIKNDKTNEYKKKSRNQINLDTFCKTESVNPDIIKIDVEGYEYEVLDGAKEIISSSKPVIFLSVHPKQLSKLNSSIEELSKLISQLNYKCLEIDGNEVNEFKLAEYVLLPKT